MQQVQQFFERMRETLFSNASSERDDHEDDRFGNERDADGDADGDEDSAAAPRFRFQGRSLLIGALVGLALGLLAGWVFFPVQWENSQLIDLSEEAQANYLAAVADAYVARRDENAAIVARQRLFDLDQNIVNEIAEAQQFFANSDALDNGVRVQNLQELAQLLGVDNEVLALNRDLLAGPPVQGGAATPDSDSSTPGVAPLLDTSVDSAAAERSLGARLGSWLLAILQLLVVAALVVAAYLGLRALRERQQRESAEEEDDDDNFDSHYREQVGRHSRAGERYGGDDSQSDEDQAEQDDNPLAFQPEHSDDSRSGHRVQGRSRTDNDQTDDDRAGNYREERYDQAGYDEPSYDSGNEDEGDEDYRSERPPSPPIRYGSAHRDDASNFDDDAEDDDFDEGTFRDSHDSDHDDSGEDAFNAQEPERIIQSSSSLPPILIRQAVEPAPPASSPPADARSAPADSATASVRNPNARIVDQQRVRYQFGSPDFDESFPIMKDGESTGGEYVGVFGVAPNEDFGLLSSDPERISTLEVWLHDASEPEGSRGQSQLLISREIAEAGLDQFFDEEATARYQPRVAEPGLHFTLETRSLRLEGEVERVEYVEREGEVKGLFRDVMINLTARQKS